MAGVYGEGHLGVSFLRGSMCTREWVVGEEVGKMGASGNRDCQWTSRSVLKDFTEEALIIAAGDLFQNGKAQIVKAKWPRRIQHRCWWNL